MHIGQHAANWNVIVSCSIEFDRKTVTLPDFLMNGEQIMKSYFVAHLPKYSKKVKSSIFLLLIKILRKYFTVICYMYKTFTICRNCNEKI